MTSPAAELIAAGNAAYAAGRFAEAIDLGRRAVAADPENPWAHNLLGAACAEEMEHAEAREAFAAAVAADPHIAQSRVNLAYALILDGEFAEAEAHLREALRLEPDMGAAFLNLSWIHRATTGDPLIARLEELRRRSSDAWESRILYDFALGKLYDDIGEYDLAFACFREGNELSGVTFEAGAWSAYFSRLKDVFSADFARQREGAGFRSDKPVFIVGMPRCGSSLLEDRLARHPAVGALGERPDIARLLAGARAAHPRGAPYPDFAPELTAQALEGLGRRYVEKFERLYPGAARLIDKNLMNFQHAALIRVILPGSRIIHCRRDPLDTCVSCYFQRLRPDHPYKFSLESLGLYYLMYANLMEHWESAMGGLFNVDYESFIDRPEAEHRRVLEALALPPAAAEIDASRSRSIQTSSAYQARQPVTKASVGRWRRYEKHLGPLIDALGPLAKV